MNKTHASLTSTMRDIDLTNPLRTPIHMKMRHVGPRLDRLEAKITYLVEYVEYLETRVAQLEDRETDATT